MVSGHFDPFTHGHLSYLQQALGRADNMVCIVSSDEQLKRKKRRVNIPALYRARILDLILSGLYVPHSVYVNIWDTETTLVANALMHFKPDIFFRGGDKTLGDMPPEERQVCEELGIRVEHAVLEHDIHGSDMTW